MKYVTQTGVALCSAFFLMLPVTQEVAAATLTINNGATVQGSGTIDGDLVTNGNLQPGDNLGCLALGNLTLAATASYTVELGGTTACTNHDQIGITGTVDLGGATLSVSTSSYTLAAYDTFTIINNDGTDPITNTFNGLAEDASFSLDGKVVYISYQGGDGNDVVINYKYDDDNDGLTNDVDLDNDNDGYSDSDENDNGTSPTDPNDTPPDNDGDLVSDLNDSDDDNDGFSDDDETDNGTSTIDAGDSPPDADGDGISDLYDNDDNNDGVLDGLDPNWNSRGLADLQVVSPFDPDYDAEGFAVAIQNDGKILLAGDSQISGGSEEIFISRFNDDGTLDTSFDSDGVVNHWVANKSNEVRTVLPLSNGKLVVLNEKVNSDEQCGLVGFNNDGSLDTGFGTNGITAFDILNNDSQKCNAAELDLNNRIVSLARDGSELLLVRTDTSGNFDTGFDTDGIVETGEASTSSAHLALQSDDKPILLSKTDVLRYNTDGSLDTSFATNGRYTLSLSDSTRYNDVRVLADDSIMVLVGLSTSWDLQLIKLLADGSGLDTSFGTNGIVTISAGSTNFFMSDFDSFIEQNDGKLMIVAESHRLRPVTRSRTNFTAIRLNANGAIDTTFATSGYLDVLLSDNSGTSWIGDINNLVQHPDGKIIVAGEMSYGYANGGDTMLAIRFESETNTDGDGLSDSIDPDDDNDGVNDSDDAFPLDSTETTDTDGDGIGNNADTDDDNDGVSDTNDDFPLDSTESTDTDGDGIGNNADTDDDNDGVNDSEDAFPLDPSESQDSDGDGIGDNADDTPYPYSGDFDFEFAEYSVAENGTSVEIRVIRTNGDYEQATLDFSLEDGTAIATSDYEFTSGTLIFADGELEQSIILNILDDIDYEGHESFSVRLSNLQSIGESAIGSISTATITITEDDPVPPAGEITFDAASYQVDESEISVELTIVRTGGSYGEVSVSLATQDDTAVAGQDYVALSQMISFADGETEQAIQIDLLNDSNYESDEAFLVVLSNVSGGATLGASSAGVTILDDDPEPPAGVFSIESDSISVVENAGSVELKIVRSNGSFGEVFVDVASQNIQAIADEDFQGIDQRLRFVDGEVEKTLTVTVLDDEVYEGDETFSIKLSNAIGGALASPSEAIITIVEDDEAPPAGLIQFSGEHYEIGENETSLTVTVTRINGSFGELSVDVSVIDDTAVNGTDMIADSTNLTFMDGELSRSFDIEIINNDSYQGDRRFSLALTNLIGSGTIGAIAQTEVLITDDETAPTAGNLQLSNNSYFVQEDNTSVTVTVLRVAGSFGDISVDYQFIDNSAVNGQDYLADNGTLYFADGEMTQELNVELIDDLIAENSESFSFELINPVNTQLQGDAKAVITIVDNEVEEDTQESDSSSGGSVHWLALVFLFSVIRVRCYHQNKLAKA